MSADKQLEIAAKTDNGVTHSFVRMFEGELRGKAGHKITREDWIAAFKDDPNMAGFVEAVKRKVPAGSLMWLTNAGTGTSAEGPIINMTVRYG